MELFGQNWDETHSENNAYFWYILDYISRTCGNTTLALVVLHHCCEYSVYECACGLGMSFSSAKYMLEAARKNVRKEAGLREREEPEASHRECDTGTMEKRGFPDTQEKE
jgi:hypothetical protein